MNIRVVAIVLIIILFALVSGFLSYSLSGGTPLKEAYNNGNIQVIQKTAAGTVPHEVVITNNQNKAIKAKKGDILTSSVSQDVVIAEDKTISPNSNETVNVYCIEPNQRANAGTNLLPVNNTYSAVNEVINNSNPSDPQSAMKAQLQIWIIMFGNNFNPYTGEPVAVMENQNITWTQFRQDIANAKNDVMTSFNVTEDQIQNLNQNQAQSNARQTQSWANNILNWIKSL